MKKHSFYLIFLVALTATFVLGGSIWVLAMPTVQGFVGEATTTAPSLVTERWGANSTAEYPANTIDTSLNGLHPDWAANNGSELVIRSGGGYDAWALLYFDVSNLPVTTTIRSASLNLHMMAHCQCDVSEGVHAILDPDGAGLWSETDATFAQRRPGVAWSQNGSGDLSTVLGPELDRVYLGTHEQWSKFWATWDVTAAVQEWVANPASNSGLVLPHIADALYTAESSEATAAELRPYLQITYEGPNPHRPAQASGLAAFHRSGQTFITWDEIGSGDASEAYRIYRSSEPITADNLDQATLLAEIPAGSGYYEHEDVGCSAGSNCSPIGQRRFIIEDGGDPLPEGRGLFVNTVHDAGIFYYAVTSLVQGNENRQDLGPENALSSGISESEATPQPVRVWSNATNTGWVYTQFMDYSRWNPTYEGYAYNFYI
ncbi:MAG: DNRLRE domain-containing protein, partial [Chloroflexi bacterium]|nr:DNRLRE domain-containing protein [Chloroflexota bacterium]